MSDWPPIKLHLVIGAHTRIVLGVFLGELAAFEGIEKRSNIDLDWEVTELDLNETAGASTTLYRDGAWQPKLALMRTK